MEVSTEPDDEKNIFTFQDIHPEPDPVFEYTDSMSADEIPLIIDNGSYKCRAGWMSDDVPRLIFKNLVAKQRSKKNPQETLEVQIGNDIGNLEVVRWQLKSPFERDIVTQYDCQEQVFDYTFTHLGINTNGFVNHPVVLTEAVCNPNYCRQKMSELLFECYQVPSVAYGVDALFSLYKNHPSPETANALVLSCGYNTTHVLPVIDGRLDTRHARRLNLGGSHMEVYLQKLLQLKYPGHLSHISLSRAEEVLHSRCKVAVDYQESLLRWADEDYYCDSVYKYQLPFSAAATSLMLQDAQKERREQQVKRLKDINKKKREEKLAEGQEKLRELMTLQELYEDEDDDTFQRALSQYDITSPEELQERLTTLSIAIQRLRQKLLQDDMETRPIGNDLLGIPDEMLTGEQREQKRRQKLYNETQQQQQGSRGLPKADKKMDLSDLVPDDSPEGMEGWIKGLRRQRQELIDKRAGRKQRKSDMTKRRTHASQQRMKIITELARGSRKKKDDNFGANDEDWNVYKQINKDAGDSDSEAEQEKIEEIETLLREYDPNFKDPNQVNEEVDVKEYYRIHIGVEQIRIPELLFQPSMIGIDHAGLSETIEFVLSKYSAAEQNRLVQHVFVTGGAASFPHLVPRISRDLQAMRPFQSSFKLHLASDPTLDPWYGAKAWAAQHLAGSAITRADYEEKGAEYLREHAASNLYRAVPVTASSTTAKNSPLKGSPLKTPKSSEAT